jgi:hypothetical protein
MKELKATNVRPRVFALALVSVAAACGAWAVYTYGPRPAAQEAVAPANARTSEADTQSQPPKDETKNDETKKDETREDTGDAAATHAPDFFAGLDSPAASGRVEGSRADFIERVETTYRQRGYKNLGDVLNTALKKRVRRPKLGKYYWKYETKDSAIAFIGATGTDADPTSDKATPSPATFTTVVTSDGEGGERWVTYRRETKGGPSRGACCSKDADSPGIDPPGVPRPPGLRRVFSFDGGGAQGAGLITFYTSSESGLSIVRWYMEKMTPNWQYEPVATAQAKAVSEGAMCFTQGRRFCLVWVAAGRGGEQTSVIVSYKG